MKRQSAGQIRKFSIWLLIVVVAAVGGFLLGRDGRQLSPSSRKPAAAPSPELTPPVERTHTRTRNGAVSAATRFELLTAKDDLFDRDALGHAMEALAAPSWRTQALRQGRRGYEYIRRTYGSHADVTNEVLRFRVASFSPTKAKIDLWTVSVARGAARPTVDSVWAIVTVDLQWLDGEWRVNGLQTSVGPTPISLAAGGTSKSASEVMDSFTEFNGPPSP